MAFSYSKFSSLNINPSNSMSVKLSILTKILSILGI